MCCIVWPSSVLSVLWPSSLVTALQGSLETLAEEISDTLNEALDSASFMHTFPGTLRDTAPRYTA